MQLHSPDSKATFSSCSPALHAAGQESRISPPFLSAEFRLMDALDRSGGFGYCRSMLLILLVLLPVSLLSAPQQMDADFAKSVKEWTTKPEFISPLVDHLPKSNTIPSPKDILGYHIGAPKKLTYYGDLLMYYAPSPLSPRGLESST